MGTLYVVSTPIGNLGDLSARALDLLRTVAVIAAEDTRTTRKLLSHYGIATPCVSYHAHSGPARGEALLRRLAAGEHVALVSDAGTPGISDPGGELVRDAVRAGIRVVPIPGASALLAALVASGLDPTRFVFEGFLPRSAGDRRRQLEALANLPHTLIFYEAPGRVAETLSALAEGLGDRPAVVAREVTKHFEEFRRGSLRELAAGAEASPPRGECVLLVEGRRAEAPVAEADLVSVLRGALAAGRSVRDAARDAAAVLGVPRAEAYALALTLTAANHDEATADE